MDHRRDFEWLVMDKCGKDDSQSVEWSAPRLICIAGDFTKYDVHAVNQMNRNIELIRYRRFSDDLLLLDLLRRFAIAPAMSELTGLPMPLKGGQKAVAPRELEGGRFAC